VTSASPASNWRFAANGSVVTTLEGIAGDQLTPLQEAFWDEYAFQCGFCLSGMLFSAQDLIDRIPNPTDHEIRTCAEKSMPERQKPH